MCPEEREKKKSDRGESEPDWGKSYDENEWASSATAKLGIKKIKNANPGDKVAKGGRGKALKSV